MLWALRAQSAPMKVVEKKWILSNIIFKEIPKDTGTLSEVAL